MRRADHYYHQPTYINKLFFKGAGAADRVFQQSIIQSDVSNFICFTQMCEIASPIWLMKIAPETCGTTATRPGAFDFSNALVMDAVLCGSDKKPCPIRTMSIEDNINDIVEAACKRIPDFQWHHFNS
jgi:hypothetical protein